MAKLLFLHGALGSKQQFQPLVSVLGNTFEVSAIDFSGHGNRASEETTDFSIRQFGQDVISWMDENGSGQVDILGYSMGGYVALWLASHYPERIGKVMTLATKFAWTPEAAEKEKKLLDPKKIKEKVPAFAAQLAQVHGANNWEKVMANTAQMMLDLGVDPLVTQAQLKTINIPVQVMVGDQDNMVSISETAEAYSYLPNGRFGVLPGTKHPLEKVSTERLVFEIKEFFN